MTQYGKIKSYDSNKGSGTITPERGGETIAFVKADLQQQAREPKVDQRFGYETRQMGSEKPHAVNLQLQQGQREQAEQQKG